MALTQPTLYTVSAFDATNDENFIFNVIGGDQVTGSILTIKNNITLETVYTGTQNSFKLVFVLPANTLINGTYYQAFIQTKNAAGQTSIASNIIQFYCFSQPEITFTNIPKTINNSSFNFEATYTQSQNELLNTYSFNLYSLSNNLLSTSGILYNQSSSLPISLNYIFSGFNNNSQYYIQVSGVTAHGMNVESEKVLINISYENPTVFNTLYLNNNCNEGYITIISNLIAIDGQSNPSPPVYINNESVDLTQIGSWVKWNQGYSFDTNYNMGIWGKNFIPNSTILQFSNINNDKILINYNEKNNQVCVELYAFNSNWNTGYYIYSSFIPIPLINDNLFIFVSCINNIFNITITNQGDNS